MKSYIYHIINFIKEIKSDFWKDKKTSSPQATFLVTYKFSLKNKNKKKLGWGLGFYCEDETRERNREKERGKMSGAGKLRFLLQRGSTPGLCGSLGLQGIH